MNFLIALLAIILLEAYGELSAVQRDDWVRRWHKGLGAMEFLVRPSTIRLALFVAVPVILLHLVLVALSHQWGLLVFVLELLVLLYAMGRGNLDTQIALFTSDLEKDDLRAAFDDATVFDLSHREGVVDNIEGLREQIFASLPYRIFERTFVVIFWFYLFGAPAALAYRLLALHGDLDMDKADADAGQPELKWLWLMEWLPVRLLGLTVGLVGNFSYAASAVRKLLFCRSTGTAEFLRQAVKGALGDEQASRVLTHQTVSEVTLLFGRAMTGWLVVIAILVILS
jgi:AmpE protein